MADESIQEIVDFYTTTFEESRLGSGSSQLEFERTKELLQRFLPPPPATVVDIGGGSGTYAFWLAGLGYVVHLVDATPRLAELARRQNETAPHTLSSISVGDARKVTMADGSADAVLLLGPLYHLLESPDRSAALSEARRILRPDGVLAAAAISRYAGTLDGLIHHSIRDNHLVAIRHAALASGRYRNDTGNPRYFVTAYFHRPEELMGEVAMAGFHDVKVLGIEGPGWLAAGFESRWNDEGTRSLMLEVARLLEDEASIVGISAHLLAVGRNGF
jgi:ubiquinone/menaquinone biosynthesis C-methylase UbiE